jgi:hypothetical protein
MIYGKDELSGNIRNGYKDFTPSQSTVRRADKKTIP